MHDCLYREPQGPESRLNVPTRPDTSTRRIWRRLILAAIAVGPFVPEASGETVSVDLGVTPETAVNRLTMTITATLALGGTRSDTDTATVSGNVLADLGITFDPVTGLASSVDTLELTGGHVSLSDMSFRLNWGWLLGLIDLQTTGLGATFDTPNPPGSVLAGAFDAAEHVAILNEGTLLATGSGLVGDLLPENPYTFDLSQEPLTASGQGTGILQLSDPTIEGSWARYAVLLRLPVFFDQVIYEQPAAQVRVRAEGTFEARGEIVRSVAPGPPTWNTDGGGSWGSPGNWTGAVVPDGTGAKARFGEKLTAAQAPAVITLDSDRRLGILEFDNANSYRLVPGSGGALTLDNGADWCAVGVEKGSHEIASLLRLAGNTAVEITGGSELAATGGMEVVSGLAVRKLGDGVLRVRAGLRMHDGATLEISAGVVDLDRVLGGTLAILPGATVCLDAQSTAGGASDLDRLEIAGSSDAWLGRLDLNGGQLVIRTEAGEAAAVLARITNQIKTARNSTTGRWLGPGITSSVAQADASGLTGLAILLNDNGSGQPLKNEFGGRAVDASSILLRYTWNGDVNLDGKVNADDYFRIDSGFLTQPGQPRYQDGDFNFDGKINADDYYLIDLAFLGQTAPTGSMCPGRSIAVPEPETLWPVAGVLVGLTWRGRRSRTQPD